jgi:uncharacterized protein YndB with AHSA1/START domain
MTSVSVDVDAPAERVWALLSDLTRMSEWSPETEKVQWLDGAAAATVGARFRGSNRKGIARWSTTSTVTVADPPSTLAWEVKAPANLPVAEWRYLIEPITDTSCRVTESTTDRRSAWFRFIGDRALGLKDRGDHNPETMRITLERLKLAAESPQA